jgi:5'-methylthioadenosine phosphorylase
MSQIKLGVIGGTGLGQLLVADGAKRHDVKTPFGAPSDAIFETQWDGVGVLLLSRHGPGHLIQPSQAPFRANIFALKQLGCTHIIATGACGSLRQEFKPRDLVVPDQIIDRTSRRAGTFFENTAVHVEFAEPFCPVLRRMLLEGGAIDASAALHDRGCYVCMEGPAFSTRAESLMHRLWGGDLIGMTAMPEAKLAREAEIPYALIGLVTDYDSWRPKPGEAPGQPAKPADPGELLKEISVNLQAVSVSAIQLIRRAIQRMAADAGALLACPARTALQFAIWSEKSEIPAAEVQRLFPLWGKYFG